MKFYAVGVYTPQNTRNIEKQAHDSWVYVRQYCAEI